MTVYELIKALAKFEADAEVEVCISVGEPDRECEHCGEMSSGINKDYTCLILGTTRYNNSNWKILISCDLDL